MMYPEEAYLMLSGIQHFAFCERQWAIIHIEQQWAENYWTTAGELMHKKAHDEGAFEKRGNLLTVRGLRISSRELGLSGQCDIVEFHEDEAGVNLFGRNVSDRNTGWIFVLWGKQAAQSCGIYR